MGSHHLYEKQLAESDRPSPLGFARYFVLAIFSLLFVDGGAIAWGQMTPTERAELLLDTGLAAFEDGNYEIAEDRLYQLLTYHASHPQANSARLALGITRLHLSPPEEPKAITTLSALVDKKDFVDLAYAHYYLGLALRMRGYRDWEQYLAKPQDASLIESTHGFFKRAVVSLKPAVQLFDSQLKTPTDTTGTRPSEELETALRARCDLAEMQLHLGRAQDAWETTEIFFKDRIAGLSRSAVLGNYFHGHAAFLLKDYATAEKALEKARPFPDLEFSTHSRYLLARVHHEAGRPDAAATLYTELIADYEREVANAKNALRDAAKLDKNPAEKQRLENLVKLPSPPHVARSAFYLGTTCFEQQKFAAAKEQFGSFAAKYPQSLLADDSKLWLGICLGKLQQFGEADEVLRALQDHHDLGDQARTWIARWQIAAADQNNEEARVQGINAAIKTLQGAAAKAKTLAGTVPAVKLRRDDILMEQADLLQSLGKYNEAINLFREIMSTYPTTPRSEDATQRLTTAYALAGNGTESDKYCNMFILRYPKHPLLPAVLFRSAENLFARAEETRKKPKSANRDFELKERYTTAEQRYMALLELPPVLPQASYAWYGRALCHYRLGKYKPAAEAFRKIPAEERVEQLTPVSFLLADCHLQLVPEAADEGQPPEPMVADLKAAIQELETFVAAHPSHQLTPEALLKIGRSALRLATLTADADEKSKVLQQGWNALDTLVIKHAKSEVYAIGHLERANVLVAQGNIARGINELSSFAGEPLKATPIAPLALVRLASLHRSQGKPVDAERVLTQARQSHEASLLQDDQRSAWAAVIQLNLGLALLDQNKFTEARNLFDATAKQFADKPEGGEAVWRSGECRRIEAISKITTAKQKLAQPELTAGERAAAEVIVQKEVQSLAETVKYLEAALPLIGSKFNSKSAHFQLLYEVAWAARLLGQEELAAARQAWQEDQRKKLIAAAGGVETKEGKLAAVANIPEPPLSKIATQSHERKAREHYLALSRYSSKTPLALRAQFELAEVYALREEWDAAINLLKQLIDLNPPAELLEKARLRLGSCYLAKKELEQAAAEFDAVGNSRQPLVAAEARLRAAEIWISREQWDEALTQLTPLRDDAALNEIAGVSDRGMVRLAFVLGQKGDWSASRVTCKTCMTRFPKSVWNEELQFALAQSYYFQDQFDSAMTTYRSLTGNSFTELAARAQLQIGRVRVARKKYPEALSELLIIPYTYDYPELAAQALVEAAQVYVELKQPEWAIKVLKKVLQDYPTAAAVPQARQHLTALQGE